MKEKNLSQEESLKVIHEMIEMAKNKICETGFHFLLWGCLVISASLLQYIMLQKGMEENSNYVWIIMPLIGFPIAMIYEYKKKKQQGTQTKFDSIYGFLWLGFGITLTLTIVISLYYHLNPIAFILILVGLTTFVSGAIHQFPPLIIGSIAFWISGLLCTQADHQNQLLINAAATFIGYVIPGFLLWKKSKKVNHV